MAIRLEDEYANSEPASAAYPEGSFKNSTSPTTKDGTPLEKAWGDDIYGFLQALLSGAGISPSGAPDTALVSQYKAGIQFMVDAVIPSGTKMVFVQASAPVGWTLDTTAAYNTAGLRIVTGAGGGTGGTSDAFSAHTHSTPAHTHTTNFAVAGHTLSVSEIPAHTHSGGSGGTVSSGTSGVEPYYTMLTTVSNTGSTGGGTAHTHSFTGGVTSSGAGSSGSFAPKYIDSIICVKG